MLPPDTPPASSAEQRIMTAARALFLERGYAATSMDEVSRRAHASKTTLYNHFPSKEALFAACVKAECTAAELGLQPQILTDLPLITALEVIGRRFLDLASSPAAIRIERVLASEAPRFPTLAATFWEAGPKRIQEAVASYFATAQAKGLIAPGNPAFMARAFLSMLDSRKFCAPYDETTALTSDEQGIFVRQTVSLLLTGLLPRS